MLNKWKSKFNSKEFSLNVDEPETFVICQWQSKTIPSIWYFIYRWIISIYFLTTWIMSILEVKDTPGYQAKYVIYLTNWGYTLCTLQAFVAAVMISGSLLSYRSMGNEYYKCSALKIYKIYWCINVVATPIAFIITVIYWSFIYEPKVGVEAINVLVHGMNSVMMLLDFWMLSHPVRLAHFFYPLVFASVYVTFSVIYYLAGGTSREGTNYIYPILDWSKPWDTILVVFIVALFAIFLHVLIYFMYVARKTIYKKLGDKRKVELSVRMTQSNNQRGYFNEVVMINDDV